MGTEIQFFEGFFEEANIQPYMTFENQSGGVSILYSGTSSYLLADITYFVHLQGVFVYLKGIQM
jgi:hypothetical protein